MYSQLLSSQLKKLLKHIQDHFTLSNVTVLNDVYLLEEYSTSLGVQMAIQTTKTQEETQQDLKFSLLKTVHFPFQSFLLSDTHFLSKV